MQESDGSNHLTPLNRVGNRTATSVTSAVTLIDQPAPSDSNDLSRRPEWQLALRIAASKRLSKSDLLPRFLLFICEQSLLGNHREITEQRIGTQIFNRPAGYNPGEDNIVRSYARLLRKRLTEYFDAEGRDEPMRLVIPRGGYLPLFEAPSAATHPPATDLLQTDSIPVPSTNLPQPPPTNTSSTPSPTANPTRPWLPLLFAALAGALLTSAAWLGIHAFRTQQTPLPAHPLWAQLFNPDHNTLIVPADSGLGILQNLSGNLVSLDAYANGTYSANVKPIPGVTLDNLNDLRQQRYTSLVDLQITAMLTQLPEYSAGHTQIRFARSITTDDLKDTNVILLGSSHSNPWVSLFDKTLNFKLQYMPAVNRSYVLNDHPQPSEQTRYQNGTNETANLTYGVIDYLPSLDGAGHVLIIQGLNMAATQAAADTLFDPQALKPILKAAALPNGSLRPFELLIETNSIGATAPRAHIIAMRIH
jgi:hypothetical protein